MHSIRHVQIGMLALIRFLGIRGGNPALHRSHGPHHVDGAGVFRFCQCQAIITHCLQKALFSSLCIFRGDGWRTDEDPDVFGLTPINDLRDTVQIGLPMFRIRLHAPANIIHPIGNSEHRRSFGNDCLVQTLKTELGRFAAFTSVDEADFALWKSHQRVVLDDSRIIPCRRNAIAQKGHGVTVAEGEFIRTQRGQRESENKQ